MSAPDSWPAPEVPVGAAGLGLGVPADRAFEHETRAGGRVPQQRARCGREHAFAAEARALLDALPAARGHIAYSRPRPRDLAGRHHDSAGRLSAPLLESLGLPVEAEAHLCGPTRFIDDVSAALAALGIDPARIHTERFGPQPPLTPGIEAAPRRPPHPPDGEPGSGPTVELARSHLTVRWQAGFTSLLDLAEACDVSVRWACRTGVCRSCETALLSGEVHHAPEPVEPPARGSALICCARPCGDLVLDL